MELRHLRYFSVVARLQHFHKAAEELHITQPALSNQIKQLEEELVTKLFERVGRGVKLSESGQHLLKSAGRILNEVEHIKGTIEELELGTAGALKIGVLQSINTLYLRQIVVMFDKVYPNVSLQISELPNNEIERQIAEGEIDLGIGFILDTPNRDIQSELLFQERWKIVVAPQHDQYLRKILMGKHSGLKAILFPEYFETRKIVNQYFKRKNISFRQITEVNSINSMLDLVENGNSFTILPEAFSVFRENHQLISHYINDLPPRQIGILTRKGRLPKRSMEKFRDLIFKQLYTDEVQNK